MRKHILFAAAVVFFVSSCREDTLDLYNGANYVHFLPNSYDRVETSYNFALGKTTREESVSVPVPIRLWGYLPEKDFKCSVSVASSLTDARTSDYELSPTAVFRKGFPVDTLWVSVNRRPELLSTDYVLTVHLDSAEEHVAAPSSYLDARIEVKDAIMSAPLWWNTTNAFGEYSDMKFRVLNYYLGRYLGNLDGYTTITLKAEALSFKAWWEKEWKDGRFRYFATDAVTPLYETIPE